MNLKLIFAAALLLSASIYSHAGSETLDAAIGGGVGGAIGAALGNEAAGGEGAIIGGAIGAATGAAIATRKEETRHHYVKGETHYQLKASKQSNGNFCPPGQAKKGNC